MGVGKDRRDRGVRGGRALILLAAGILLAARPDPELEGRRDAVCARIEELRGLKFAAKVPITDGTKKDAGAVALESARELYGGDLAPFEKAAKAMGFFSERIRLEVAIPVFSGATTQAYYGRRTMYVVDRAVPDDELVFKFTLALAEQQADWKAHLKSAGGSVDAQLALAALRQGSADMTKQLHWSGLKASDKRSDGDHLRKLVLAAEEYENGKSKWLSAVAPRLFVRSSDFAWRRGGIFMETLRASGKHDAAFKTPPKSTEQILHPEKYLAGEDPASIDLTPAAEFMAAKGWKPAYATTLGELACAIWLETFVDEAPCAASAGWESDRLEVWTGPGEKAGLAWTSTWDTAADAAEFEACARKAAAGLAKKREGSAPEVARRGRSVLIVSGIPADLRPGLVDAAWAGTVRRGGTASPLPGKEY